jgi:Flp pilus assembly protein TadD
MSLISDALKTAQRERSGRNTAANASGQTLIEGFFPFVSTSAPSRSRGKRIAVISGASVVLLGVAAYLALPAFRAKPDAKRGPIIQLPPAGVSPRQAVTPPATAAPTVRQEAVVDTASAAVLVEAARKPEPQQRRITPATIGAVTSETKAAGPETKASAPVIEAATESGNRPAVRRDYEAQATMLFNAGDWEGARAQFQLAVKNSPNARAWTNYGVTLQRLHDLAGARSAYQSAVGLDGSYLEAWLFNARVAMELGEAQVAVPLLLRARSINPRHSGVNSDLAQLESEAKNYTESRKYAEEALRADPANARAHWYLAIAADQLSDAEVATREYNAYLQVAGGPENARTAGYARERLEMLRKKP